MTLAFTTRTAAAESDELLEAYPYWVWYPDENQLAISKNALNQTYYYDGNGVPLKNPNTGATIATNTYYYYTIYSTVSDSVVILRWYPDLGIWQAELPWIVDSSKEVCVGFGSSLKPTSSSFTKRDVYTNGHTPTGSSTSGFNVTTSLPSDMPEVTLGVGDIDTMINDALNATTTTTTQAQTIQSNIGSTYADYTSGAITAAEFQAAMDQYQQQLEDLANKSGNTLADQVAVNNAITYAQTVQLNVTQTASSEVAQALNEAITNVTNVFTDYVNGYITEAAATTQINQYVTQVTNLMQQSTSAADLEAINAALAAINGYREAIADSGDLDKTVSDAAESSDAAEKAYLEELTAETTASIQDISPREQFTDTELGTAQEVLGIIWENKLVKRLLVICGCFMVVCVVLGIRYKV